jgi:hypothetical protein
VVSIAFAKIGLVSLCKVSSEMLAPGIDDLVEMRRDYLGASRPKRGVQLYPMSSSMSTKSTNSALGSCVPAYDASAFNTASRFLAMTAR